MREPACRFSPMASGQPATYMINGKKTSLILVSIVHIVQVVVLLVVNVVVINERKAAFRQAEGYGDGQIGASGSCRIRTDPMRLLMSEVGA